VDGTRGACVRVRARVCACAPRVAGWHARLTEEGWGRGATVLRGSMGRSREIQPRTGAASLERRQRMRSAGMHRERERERALTITLSEPHAGGPPRLRSRRCGLPLRLDRAVSRLITMLSAASPLSVLYTDFDTEFASTCTCRVINPQHASPDPPHSRIATRRWAARVEVLVRPRSPRVSDNRKTEPPIPSASLRGFPPVVQ